jgi:deoxyribose-phosphate aldolase
VSRPHFRPAREPTDVKVREVEEAVALGADEIDMVIDRGAFLSAATPRSSTRSCA